MAEAEAGAAQPNPNDLAQEIKFNFNFESGKYKVEEIPAAESRAAFLTNGFNPLVGPPICKRNSLINLITSVSTVCADTVNETVKNNKTNAANFCITVVFISLMY